MLLKKLIPIVGFIFLLCFYACKDNGDYLTDQSSIDAGLTIFDVQCGGCHSFKNNGLGPSLGGLTKEIDQKWIKSFIRNPSERIFSGDDDRALEVYEKYNTVMPSFPQLSEDELSQLLAYINIHEKPKEADIDQNALTDPIGDTIGDSGLIIDLKEITQFPNTSEDGKYPYARINKLAYHPFTKELFVSDHRGKIYVLRDGRPQIYLNLADHLEYLITSPGLATGLGSFAFHPNFAQNGRLYISHTEPKHTKNADFPLPDTIMAEMQWVLEEWTTDDPNALEFEGVSRELIRFDMQNRYHGMQDITFNPRASKGTEEYGLLYIGIGDGGAVENGYPFLAGRADSPWGTVLRIDPLGKNSDNGQYGIPDGNPFKDDGVVGLKEVYCFGFRNPHRLTWTEEGKLLVFNIGHFNIESIYMPKKGAHCGWPNREGTFEIRPEGDMTLVYPLPADEPIGKYTYPWVQYDHDDGNAITGGYIYEGDRMPSLKGFMFFGDIPTGRLYMLNMESLEIKTWRPSFDGGLVPWREVCGSDRVDLHLGQDADGEIYFMTKADGRLYKMDGITLGET